MKKTIRLIFFLLFIGLSSLPAQTKIPEEIYNNLWANKDSSIFSSVKNGEFKGTASGHFKIKNEKDTLTLNFKLTKALLNITPDPEETYDNSTKRYLTKTKNENAVITYEIYALANILSIQLNGSTYSIGIIDGASDMPVPGLTFNYFSENNTEYLTLYTIEPLELSTKKEVMKQKKMTMQDAKIITLLPGSNLIFSIKK
ncbi:MAG TPA: hypothetical protein VLB84_20615 [Bacteroidia bacterium]|nr:hypothetical protein [Bacteroidia bacterium]